MKTKKQTNHKQTGLAGACTLWIMLDVPDLNSSGNVIHWNKVINSVSSQLKGATFIPEEYRHISLVWNKLKQPLAQDARIKIDRALSQANEELKRLYPHGVKNIALLDGAFFLEGNAVVFEVAKNPDLIKIIDTMLASFASEGLKGFECNGIKGKTPLHVTLGRIIPEKQAYAFREQIQKLSAPSGARASQGESFASNLFRTSCSPTDEYLFLGSYTF